MTPLFEDNHLLVLNKPGGLLTQPDNTGQDSLEAQAKSWIKKKDQKKGNVYLHAVHRIDKPVSGVVLFAKTSKALSRLNASMREKETRKIYSAWVEGTLSSNEGVLEDFMVHDDFRAAIVPSGHPDGKKARLSYRVIEKREGKTLLEIQLETGRYHQIRLQFSSRGHPILGDKKYGSKQPYKPHCIALHHRLFEIPHPVTKERMGFEAPLPEEF